MLKSHAAAGASTQSCLILLCWGQLTWALLNWRPMVWSLARCWTETKTICQRFPCESVFNEWRTLCCSKKGSNNHLRQRRAAIWSSLQSNKAEIVKYSQVHCSIEWAFDTRQPRVASPPKIDPEATLCPCHCTACGPALDWFNCSTLPNPPHWCTLYTHLTPPCKLLLIEPWDAVSRA